MCNRIIDFFTTSNLLSKTQHGYQKGKSCQTAIFQFTQNIIEALEKSEVAMALFFDLTKAFDCLDHFILLDKLERYGIRGPALAWFESYLSDRKQFVRVDKEGETGLSEIRTIDTGVAQGGVAGPLLLIVYLNDIAEILEETDCFSLTNYSDDTNILIRQKLFPDLLNSAGNILKQMKEWFSSNKLFLNDEKTNAMIIRTNRPGYALPTEIVLNKEKMKLTNSTKFLGMTLDCCLSWNCHVEETIDKLNRVSYCIRILRRYVDDITIKMVYHANFESVFRYGIVFYGNSRDIKQIFVVQKRVIRTMAGIGYRESCRGHFRRAKILTLSGVYIQECLLFFYKNRELFKEYEPQNVYETRTNNYSYPIHHLTMTKKTALYSCLRLFNRLPNKIKIAGPINRFKKEVHTLLMDLEPYTVEEYLLGRLA
ncbi:uncharacterized protein LOC123677982 [Harmonia axyridis]|uniref:uncharacterized protein LOC123677982 n=1 Tax=Harmonia axyridis TaxID=115357 RepID=UPI001E276305|nr:uncharacterized protein LOC123677982 [Harmonia axyridis]